MRLLLDTCTFLWLILDSPELSSRAHDLIRNPDNEVVLSVVSTWEIAITHGLGRLRLPEPMDRYVAGMRERHAIQSLELTEEASLQGAKLPNLHRDPFDRMLVGQAITHGLVIVTPDEQIRSYPIRTEW